MILLSELSRRRIRSISKLIRVGRQEAVVVLRVDKEKGAHQFPRHYTAGVRLVRAVVLASATFNVAGSPLYARCASI